MKQYTTNEQTAKLIKLGFKKPNGWYVDGVMNNVKLYVNIDENPMMFNYSIGELIELLPEKINNDTLPDMFGVYIDHNKMWTVDYSNILGELYSTYRTELIDALYDMIVKLKEEGVI